MPEDLHCTNANFHLAFALAKSNINQNN